MKRLTFAPGVFRRLAIGLPIAALALFLDQLTKRLVLTELPEARDGRVPELPFLDFVVSWNHGVSFSMASHLNHDRLIFVALALIVSAALVLWMASGAKTLVLIGLGLVTGGALGNSIDRVRFGAVEDFLYFHVAAFDWWPVFNLADSAICVGAALMVFDSLFDRPVSHKNTP
jgi:signal peptidase II